MAEPTFNQYAAPTAEVADMGTSATGELNMFSSEGRIGRLRFLAYSTGSAFLAKLLAAFLGPVSIIIAIVYLWFAVITGIKRCHDTGASGWWSILTIIPLVSFIWAFIPGDKGENRFGPPPPPNTLGVRILGLILPAVFIIGIVAAIAIPQYKAYTDKARGLQSVPQQQP
ncbi:DUF805 domain-containing protein [Burkholderiaceae bacterium UC74_6]